MILTKLLESCDANNSTRGVIDKKVMMHFILVVTDLRNARVLYVTPLTSLDNDANTNEITVQKGKVISHIILQNLKKVRVPLMMLLASSIKCPKSHVAPHLIVWTKEMQWCH